VIGGKRESIFFREAEKEGGFKIIMGFFKH
jgi:hypothetical protein